MTKLRKYILKKIYFEKTYKDKTIFYLKKFPPLFIYKVMLFFKLYYKIPPHQDIWGMYYWTENRKIEFERRLAYLRGELNDK